jgi:hypothetical protein
MCFEKGGCINGEFITESVTMGEMACLHFCQMVEGCNWFSYHSENRYFLIGEASNYGKLLVV